MFVTNPQKINQPQPSVPKSFNLQIKKSNIKSNMDELFQYILNQNLSASFDNTCYIEPTKSKLYCWGDNKNNILNIPTIFNNHTTFVETGPYHACAMTQVNAKDSQGKNNIQGARCWGMNLSGGTEIENKYLYSHFGIGMGFTCGIIIGELDTHIDLRNNMLSCQGSQIISQNNNVNVEFVQIKIPDDLIHDILYFVSGTTHVLIHKKFLQCIGLNLYGECDIPRENFEFSIKQSNSRRNSDSSYSSDNISQSSVSSDSHDDNINAHNTLQYLHASAGNSHSCAINNLNAISCWGMADHNQTTVPLTMHRPLFQSVFAGQAHNCAVSVNGIYCWGANMARQAAGYHQDKRELKQISVGGWHNCTITGENEHFNKFDNVYCWGANNNGQCLIPQGFFVYKG